MLRELDTEFYYFVPFIKLVAIPSKSFLLLLYMKAKFTVFRSIFTSRKTTDTNASKNVRMVEDFSQLRLIILNILALFHLFFQSKFKKKIDSPKNSNICSAKSKVHCYSNSLNSIKVGLACLMVGKNKYILMWEKNSNVPSSMWISYSRNLLCFVLSVPLCITTFI